MHHAPTNNYTRQHLDQMDLEMNLGCNGSLGMLKLTSDTCASSHTPTNIL